ncbi:ribonucleotide reductase [Armillaria gallica]|uniref:Ribonucleotide reductase n=1 Tax=Armillaria gallica TaxID=47427 RepID=A0A2H3DGW5_ARMGA|nr:ribonucleotide reductase [Armillaria gallica]
MDPILNGTTNQHFQLFPIEYDELWVLYKKALSAFWTTAEIDLSKDTPDWLKLSDTEQHLVSTILAFFTSSDAIVNENLVMRFCREVQIPEAQYFYTYQAMMEDIHSEMYCLLIDFYIKDPAEKLSLFHAIDEHPVVQVKADWAMKWITDQSSFSTRLVAFAAVEGIFFSSSFSVIFWLKKRGLMPGLLFSNKLITWDEGLHMLFACTLYRSLQNRVETSVIVDIILSAVDVEKSFWDGAFSSACLGLDSCSMKQYIEFVADHLLMALGCNKQFGMENPFDFMELISLEGKTNFFEKRVGEYSHPFIGQAQDEQIFSTDVDF